MIQINLLPWREQARKRKQARFGMIALVAAGAGLFFSIFFYFHYSYRISSQLNRDNVLQAFLSQESAMLAQLNEKKKELVEVDNRLNFIFTLRKTSYDAVRLLNELAITNPDSVTLYKIIRTGPDILVFGKAKSNLQITLFMDTLERSKYFDQPVLTEISGKEQETGEVRTFQLRLKQQESVS